MSDGPDPTRPPWQGPPPQGPPDPTRSPWREPRPISASSEPTKPWIERGNNFKNTAKAVVSLIVFGIIAWVMLAPKSDSPVDAQVNCHHAVEGQLRNPGSADFGWFNEHVATSDYGFVITGSLKAANGFGIAETLTYRCTATKDGTILDAQVYEP